MISQMHGQKAKILNSILKIKLKYKFTFNLDNSSLHMFCHYNTKMTEFWTMDIIIDWHGKF